MKNKPTAEVTVEFTAKEKPKGENNSIDYNTGKVEKTIALLDYNLRENPVNINRITQLLTTLASYYTEQNMSQKRIEEVFHSCLKNDNKAISDAAADVLSKQKDNSLLKNLDSTSQMKVVDYLASNITINPRGRSTIQNTHTAKASSSSDNNRRSPSPTNAVKQIVANGPASQKTSRSPSPNQNTRINELTRDIGFIGDVVNRIERAPKDEKDRYKEKLAELYQNVADFCKQYQASIDSTILTYKQEAHSAFNNALSLGATQSQTKIALNCLTKADNFFIVRSLQEGPAAMVRNEQKLIQQNKSFAATAIQGNSNIDRSV